MADRTRTPGVGEAVVFVGLLAAGVIIPLHNGAAPGGVVVSLLVMLLVGALSPVVARRLVWIPVVVALVVGAAVLSRVDDRLLPAGLAGLFAGLLLGVSVLAKPLTARR